MPTVSKEPLPKDLWSREISFVSVVRLRVSKAKLLYNCVSSSRQHYVIRVIYMRKMRVQDHAAKSHLETLKVIFVDNSILLMNVAGINKERKKERKQAAVIEFFGLRADVTF